MPTGVSWRSFGGGTEEVIALAGSVVEDEVLAPDDELFMADAADVATASADSRGGRADIDADVSSIDDDARAPPSAAAVVADELLDAMGINDSMMSALSFGRCGCDGMDESAPPPPPPPPPSVGGLRQGEGIDGVVVSIGSLEECNGNDCNANDKVGGRRGFVVGGFALFSIQY